MKDVTEKKILIFIPAYNVEKQILRVLRKIPLEKLNNHFIRILIIEDNSKDKTRQIVEDYLKEVKNNNSFELIKNEKNHGYGGVQKIAFNYALRNNFDYVIMTNRIIENRDQNTLDNVKTCFQKFQGQDIISVKRNGLMLSTLRKKL